MKIHFYGIAFLLLLFACNSPEEKPKETAPIIDPSAAEFSPDQFIGKHKAKAMVLGVFHFANPGLDDYKPRFPFNILEEKRQVELDTLLTRIAKYQPTKILIEWNRIRLDSVVEVRFKEYLNGEFSLAEKENEVFQIGFKLAKKLGHPKVYCSDAKADWFGAEMDWDNYDEDAYLKSRGQYEKANRYDYQPFYEFADSLKTIRTLTEHLAMINNPPNRLKDHQAYLTSILEGAGDNYLGADNIGRWYRRNLRIFSNAYDLTNFDEEERLLLIYGAGHVWQLRQFFTDSPDYDYVEPNDYLVK